MILLWSKSRLSNFIYEWIQHSWIKGEFNNLRNDSNQLRMELEAIKKHFKIEIIRLPSDFVVREKK